MLCTAHYVPPLDTDASKSATVPTCDARSPLATHASHVYPHDAANQPRADPRSAAQIPRHSSGGAKREAATTQPHRHRRQQVRYVAAHSICYASQCSLYFM